MLYRNFRIEETQTIRAKHYCVYTEDGDLCSGTAVLDSEGIAKIWVDGYLSGLELGRSQGKIEIQFELSKLLNLQMKAPE